MSYGRFAITAAVAFRRFDNRNTGVVIVFHLPLAVVKSPGGNTLDPLAIGCRLRPFVRDGARPRPGALLRFRRTLGRCNSGIPSGLGQHMELPGN